LGKCSFTFVILLVLYKNSIKLLKILNFMKNNKIKRNILLSSLSLKKKNLIIIKLKNLQNYKKLSFLNINYPKKNYCNKNF
jgi:hypothetical protein